MEQQRSAITIFSCYAREDEDLLEKLKGHLSPLRRQHLIDMWYDRDIGAGTEWEQEIKKHLNEAHIILLLISSDFINSDYCYDVEMKHAMARHERKEATVIPIIVRPVIWRETPIGNRKLGDLQALPKNAQPVTTWKDHDEAWKDVTEGISKVANKVLRKSSTSQPGPSSPTQEERAKRFLLSQVETDWMQHLSDSLKGQIEMTLTLQQLPRRVANPWLTLVQERATFVANSLVVDAQLLQVYDKAMGQLLILGEAGSGKTTLLLKLLRDLLARTYQDEFHPIPVVFLLSSWSIHKPTLQDWLTEQLHTLYGIDTGIASKWVASRTLLPLLDGLDEVEEDARATCVDAINSYQDTQSMNPLVVCCRSAEYERMILQSQQKLRLRQAVCIQPLTHQQMEDVLTNKGTDLDAVLIAMDRDPDLQELAASPFMLGLLIQIARDTQLSGVLVSGTRRQQIFDQYIRSVLSRHREVAQYTRAQTLSWLAWIARELDRSHQTIFYLDRMQFDCLPQEQSRRLSKAVVLLFKAIIGVGTAVAGIRIFEAFGGFIPVIGGIVFGLIGGISLARSDLVKGDIEPAEQVSWSWAGVREHLVSSLFGILLLSVGSILSLIFVFPSIAVFGLDIPLFSFMRDGMPITLGSGLLLIVQSGWTSERFDERLLRRPNQGIWRSGRHGLIVGLIFGGVSSVMFAVFRGNFVDGLLFGWIVGLAMGLLNGGLACIKHVLLRWCLWRAGSIPWHYSRFLNYAAERMLLHKVGGGYLFFHPLLLKHFVTLDRSAFVHQDTEQGHDGLMGDDISDL